MPRHTFSGRLELLGKETGGGSTKLRDDYGITEATAFAGRLPEVSQKSVQTGSHVVPVVHGLQYTGNEMWNLLVGPGRAWTEHGDAGASRAAVPFALVARNFNCTHNGTLTFLFTDATVSQVRYQIMQETCPYYAATALMRLARTRRSNVAEELIQRWVPESADAAGDWDDVTIGRIPSSRPAWHPVGVPHH